MAPSLLTVGKSGRPNKRGRADDKTDKDEKRGGKKIYFKDEDSIREQARKHRILTARMPINALTSI
jgi:hypothetical protein